MDISEYFNELYNLAVTDVKIIDTKLTNQHLFELIDKILEVKPTVLKGSVDEISVLGINFSFETSDIVWSTCDIDVNKNQYKITFKIYLALYNISLYFSFYKMLEDIFYSKYLVSSNDQIM